jgi:hypothetical protein
MLAQVMGIGCRFTLIVEQRVVRKETVVANVRLKSDFVQRFGVFAIRVDCQPLQGIHVGCGVGLANQRGADAKGAQVVADGQLFQR